MSISDERENFSKPSLAAGIISKENQDRRLYYIFGSILEMDKGRAETNRPEDKNANDDAKGFTCNYMCREKKEVDDSSPLQITWMHQYEDT